MKTNKSKITYSGSYINPEQKDSASTTLNARKLDALPDRADSRDWYYRPPLVALPDQLINCDNVPIILNQGKEGACTGFALAAVINYHLVKNGRCQANEIHEACVSPRMLYEMARRYDEWPGENYEGSSARGTIKGWAAHGVTTRKDWPDTLHGHRHLNESRSKLAQKVPSGAFYRVYHHKIRDMHAALFESGVLFVTVNVHRGWINPKSGLKSYSYQTLTNGQINNKVIQLPVIKHAGVTTNGHAVAIIGYTEDGFIIQNSWGTSWGGDGFAVLPYDDWLKHASDCWVVQIGVPVNISFRK